MNLLTLQALLALLAGAEAGNSNAGSGQYIPPPGRLGTLCEGAFVGEMQWTIKGKDGGYENSYPIGLRVTGCGPNTSYMTMRLDLCFKNDNGQLAWGLKYVSCA